MLILALVLLVVGALVGFASARVVRGRGRRSSELRGLRGLAPASPAATPRSAAGTAHRQAAPAPVRPPAPPRRMSVPPEASTMAIPSPDPTRPANRGPGTATARLEREAPPGPAIPLGRRPFTIGRRPDRDLVLDDDRVSREHATLLPAAGGGWAARDDGSSNGTRLNGHRLAARAEVPLRDGDRLTVGGVTFVFRETPAPPGGPDATRVMPGRPR